jgi:hypothetical protein
VIGIFRPIVQETLTICRRSEIFNTWVAQGPAEVAVAPDVRQAAHRRGNNAGRGSGGEGACTWTFRWSILAGMTVDEARAMLVALRPRIDRFVATRADLAELRADLATGGGSPHGGLADAKALEARLYADLEHFASAGAAVKGIAPLLLDFTGERGTVPVLWCWLEGDLDVAWYHRLDAGFAGRRPV